MENKKNYYIFLDGEKVYVPEETYKSYWKITNRENYLKRLDREYGLIYFSEFVTEDTDRNIEERLEDKSVDVEKIVRTSLQIEALNKALKQLSPEERAIIHAIFYEERTFRDIADEYGISISTLSYRKTKILEKLRKLL
jgi:RNA polymerase sigma factor (sigma-70 family)